MTLDSSIASLVLPRLLAAFNRWDTGRITLTLPDGSSRSAGAASGPQVHLTVRDWALFRRFALRGDMGAGESYMDGEWSVDDLPAFVGLVLDNRRHMELDTRLSVLLNLGHDLFHRLRANTRVGSRRNIAEHYDLSNDFFSLFLDETMTYSSAVFAREGQPLGEAQRNKYEAIARKAGLRPGLSVLEVGCGFGGFALHAARHHGCRVTGITLSRRQFELARERVARARLDHLVDIRFQDYRALDPAQSYDRVVSIEMFEALGLENWSTYFRKIEDVLAPEGWAVIQSIAIPDHRFAEYVKHCDWLQRYIFPGSVLASVHHVTGALISAGTLGLHHLEDIGPHYAPTLRAWRRSFLTEGDRVRSLGFDDRFIRMWDYYLATCEAAFATRTLQNLQMVLTRPNNRAIGAIPAALAPRSAIPSEAA